MKSARAALLTALLLVPSVGAQIGTGGTLVNPIEGDFTEVYIVTGRVVDALGNPVRSAELVVELQQRGVKAEPLRAATDCYGTYITGFTLRHVERTGKITARLRGVNGAPDAVNETALDPYFRRTDLNLSYQGQWPETSVCAEQTALWGKRVSLGGRVVNRTEPYKEGDFTYDAKAVRGFLRVRYWYTETDFACPPAQQPGLCDPVPLDERGDFKYSWVFEDPTPAVGFVEIIMGERSWNVTVDPTFRLAVAKIDTSGRGPPVVETPGLAAPALLAALVVAAFIASRRRRDA